MRRSTCSSRRRGGLVLVVLVLLAPVLAMAGPILAQGTSGSLPGPISTRDLERYAQRLGLSDEQMEAALGRHNQYRADFARLRDGEIEQFLQTVGSMGNFKINFDRRRVVKETKQVKELMGKIRTLDNRFFDSLQALLTEPQAALLPRVKQARERDRCEQGVPPLMAVFHSATRNDLSELIGRLDLPSDTAAAVDVELMQYETRLTALAKAIYETAVDMRVTTFDRLQEQGITPEALDDPDRTEGLWETIISAMDAAQQEINGESANIAKLNRRTLKNLTPYLSADEGEELRRWFYQSGYPGAMAIFEGARRPFDTALEQEDLSEEQRQSIDALRLEYRASRDRLVEQMLDLLDEQHGRMIMFNPTEEEEAEREERTKRIEHVSEEGRKLARRTGDALDAILGREITQRVAQRVAEKEAEEEDGQVQVTGVMVMSVASDGEAAGISTFTTSIELDAADMEGLDGPRMKVPSPVSHDRLMRQARYLELSDGDRMVVSAIHEDYVESYGAATSDPVALLRSAEAAARARDEETGERIPMTVADVDRLAELRRRVMTSVMESDAALFDDIEALLADKEMAVRVQRLRQARRREIYLRGSGGGGGMSFGGGGGMVVIGSGGGGEHAVDLASLVDDLKLPDETMRSIDPVLIEYEREVTEVFRVCYEAQRAADEHMARAYARAAQQAQRDGGQSFSIRAEGFDTAQAKREESQEARDRVAELNRDACGRLQEILDADGGDRLARAYDRAAWPAIFRDRLKLEDKFRDALALETLTADQRAELADLLAEYRQQREEVCRAMLENRRGTSGGTVDGAFDMESFQEQMRQREALRFQKQELGDKTLGRLRAILTAEQVELLGGLESPARAG